MNVLEFYRDMDFFVDCLLYRLDEKLTCKKGCSICCSVPVLIFDFEAKFLSQFAKSKLDKLVSQAEKGINAPLDSTKLADFWQHNDVGDCPFLENNLCSIYKYRPFSCRSLLVFSEPSTCSIQNGRKLSQLRLNQSLFDKFLDQYPLHGQTVGLLANKVLNFVK